MDTLMSIAATIATLLLQSMPSWQQITSLPSCTMTGEIGVFEYPTIDTEQMAEGEIMIKPFTVSTSWDAPLMNLTQMAEDASKN